MGNGSAGVTAISARGAPLIFGEKKTQQLCRNFISCFIIQNKSRRKKVKMAEIIGFDFFIIFLSVCVCYFMFGRAKGREIFGVDE